MIRSACVGEWHLVYWRGSVGIGRHDDQKTREKEQKANRKASMNTYSYGNTEITKGVLDGSIVDYAKRSPKLDSAPCNGGTAMIRLGFVPPFQDSRDTPASIFGWTATRE